MTATLRTLAHAAAAARAVRAASTPFATCSAFVSWNSRLARQTHLIRPRIAQVTRSLKAHSTSTASSTATQHASTLANSSELQPSSHDKLLLREHQEHTVSGCLDQLRNGNRRQLVTLPVGTGKTVVFTRLAARVPPTCTAAVAPPNESAAVAAALAVPRIGTKVLVVAHRTELLTQAMATFKTMDPSLVVGLDFAASVPNIDACDVVCASVSTLGRAGIARMEEDSVFASDDQASKQYYDGLLDGLTATEQRTVDYASTRLERYDPRDFKMIVIDECHHVPSLSYLRIIRYFVRHNPNIFVWGCTATPYRVDRKKMSNILPTHVYEMQISTAIEKGILCSSNMLCVKTSVDLTPIRLSNGDYDLNELEKLIVPNQERNIVICDGVKKAISEHNRKKILVFAINVNNAQVLHGMLDRDGISCGLILGNTPPQQRVDIISKFESGEITCVVNCGVLTEGFNIPSIDCIVLARPTLSQSLLIQMVGRGLRASPNKDYCLIVDVADENDLFIAGSCDDEVEEKEEDRDTDTEEYVESQPERNQDDSQTGEALATAEPPIEDAEKKLKVRLRRRFDMFSAFLSTGLREKKKTSIPARSVVLEPKSVPVPPRETLLDEYTLDLVRQSLEFCDFKTELFMQSGYWSSTMRWSQFGTDLAFISLPDSRTYLIVRSVPNTEYAYESNNEFRIYSNSRDGNRIGVYDTYLFYGDVERKKATLQPLPEMPRYKFSSYQEFMKYDRKRIAANFQEHLKTLEKPGTVRVLGRGETCRLRDAIRRAEKHMGNFPLRTYAQIRSGMPRSASESQIKACFNILRWSKPPTAQYASVEGPLRVLSAAWGAAYERGKMVLEALMEVACQMESDESVLPEQLVENEDVRERVCGELATSRPPAVTQGQATFLLDIMQLFFAAPRVLQSAAPRRRPTQSSSAVARDAVGR